MRKNKDRIKSLVQQMHGAKNNVRTAASAKQNTSSSQTAILDKDETENEPKDFQFWSK